MPNRSSAHPHQEDHSLCWIMRIIGLLLAGTAAFLLTRDLGWGMGGSVVLWSFAVLGVITFFSSLQRSSRPPKALAFQPQAAPVRPPMPHRDS